MLPLALSCLQNIYRLHQQCLFTRVPRTETALAIGRSQKHQWQGGITELALSSPRGERTGQDANACAEGAFSTAEHAKLKLHEAK